MDTLEAPARPKSNSSKKPAVAAKEPEPGTKAYYRLNPAKCPVCGRPTKQSDEPRGNPKLSHRNCSLLLALISQVDTRLQNVVWQDYEACREFRGQVARLISSNFNSTKTLNFAPGDDTDYSEEIDLQDPQQQPAHFQKLNKRPKSPKKKAKGSK